MSRLAIAVILAAPLLAYGADKNPDASFFKHAAEGGIAEVAAGKLAQDKGNSHTVKEFGAMMVKDHSAANDKLASLAASEGVSLPTTSSAGQMASKGKLEMLFGDKFDKAYIKDQLKAHGDAVALFKKELASGSDAQAKSFASDTLPTVQAHLMKIRRIASDAGVSASK